MKPLIQPQYYVYLLLKCILLSFSISFSACLGTNESSSSKETGSSSISIPVNYWQEKCVACHGENGEGNNDAYKFNFARIQRLYPTQSELIIFIETNMPFGDEGSCLEACSRETAIYITELIELFGVAEPPSCSAGGIGLTSCGVNGDESCCSSLPVAGGTFNRTYTNSGSGAYNLRDSATLSSFNLDKYELTVGRFRQYVTYLVAGGSPPAAGSGKHSHLNNGQGVADSGQPGRYEQGWNSAWNNYIPTGAGAAAKWAQNLSCSPYDTWTANPGGNEMMPLTCMNWYEAYAFCIWDGGFLPTEAEWKYAAAGGDEQRRYAWGSASPGTNSQYAIYECYYPDGIRGNCSSVEKNVAPVGSTPLGIGRWGQYDLAGSVWEWNLDIYGNYASPCKDCARLSGGSQRVLPGAGFHTWPDPYLFAYNRTSVNYDTTYRGDYGVGVRCGRAP